MSQRIQPPPLSPTEQQTMGDFCQLAARLAENGVYMANFHSASLSAPVLVICAIGEQALALQEIIMRNAVPGGAAIQIEKPGHVGW